MCSLQPSVHPNGTRYKRNPIYCTWTTFLIMIELIIRPKTLICIIMFIRLGCWCKPEGCHGDILVELVEKLCSVDETSATNENAGNAFCGNEEFPTLQSKQISSDLTQQHTVRKSGKTTRTTGILSNDDDWPPAGRQVVGQVKKVGIFIKK